MQYPDEKLMQAAEYPTEDPAPLQGGDRPEDAIDAEERLSIARAKATAAKNAVAQRRASQQFSELPSPEENKQSPVERENTTPVPNYTSQPLPTEEEIIEEKERELKQLEESEKSLNERFMLFGEVLALRKELKQAQQQLEDSRMQMKMLDSIVEKYDPAMEQDIINLEAAAERSRIHQVWSNECQKNPCATDNENMIWSSININDLPKRLNDVKEKFKSVEAAAVELYRQQDENMKMTAEDRKKAKLKMREGIQEELKRLTKTRELLRQLEKDQWFHIRRGTHIKEHQVPPTRRRDVFDHSVYEEESKEFGILVKLRDELHFLTEHNKGCKRQLEDNLRSYAETEQEFKEQLKLAEENGTEAHDMRVYFEKESSTLMELKQDLQRVLHYVRVHNRDNNA